MQAETKCALIAEYVRGLQIRTKQAHALADLLKSPEGRAIIEKSMMPSGRPNFIRPPGLYYPMDVSNV